MAPIKKISQWLSNLTVSRLALLLVIGIVGYLVWTEHEAHIVSALPYLVFLLCPLMHIFMHRNHGSRSNKHGGH